MNCGGCQYLGRHCGGLEGNPGVSSPTLDPLSLSSRQLLELACAVVRLGTVICDLGQVGTVPDTAIAADEPYIWDIKED